MSSNELRPRALALVEAQLEHVRNLGPDGVRELVPRSPVERDEDGIVLATRVEAEGERLLVLVDARHGRRMLATGGFTMLPDGSTHTPH